MGADVAEEDGVGYAEFAVGFMMMMMMMMAMVVIAVGHDGVSRYVMA